jgi:N,N'-diacetylchitobiose transport system permease protein
MSAGRTYTRRGRTVAYLIAIVTIVCSFFPIYWMLVTVFQPDIDTNTGTPHLLPRHLTTANWTRAMANDRVGTYLRNSLIITLSTVVLTVVIAFVGATALARFTFRGRTLCLVMLLVLQMIPTEAMIIPVYQVLRDGGQLDKFSSVILLDLGFVLPFAIWTMRSFIAVIPVELEEAAMVDGCSRAGAFRRILLPLVTPGLVTIAVYAFIQAWQEFIFSYIIMSSPEHYPLHKCLADFTTLRGTDWSAQMAASLIFALPAVVLFLAFQRRLAGGLAAGAVKG